VDYQYINSNELLRQFCDSIQQCRYCALDTEFVREKTYFPLLALIQLATESHQACIDPLAIDDFSPLVELFNNHDMVKILHAPSQDLELFHLQFDALPRPVFDTQLAAAVLGYANQIGYADLVNRLCKVQLDKKYTRANWARRPLSEGELDYAMDDVRYLIEIYDKQNTELENRGRLSWVQGDFEQLSEAESYQQDVAGLWRRLKGVQRLKGPALNNADQLCRWRERVAIQKNRPRRWIIKDEDIVDIARFKPGSHHDLEQIGNLSKDYIRKIGDDILQVLAEAEKIDSSEYPKAEKFATLNNQQQAIADCLMAICRDVTEKNDIALASVTTKKEVDALVTGNRDTKLCSGWRFEMLGQHLVSFLEGENGIRCVEGRIEY
jgi:ribonuclease D